MMRPEDIPQSVEVVEPERYALIVRRVGMLTPAEARAEAQVEVTRAHSEKWEHVEVTLQRASDHGGALGTDDLQGAPWGGA
ncbi:hypothetical protein ACFYY8_31240 [Streptosporangium sp. NPDC001559]|uniref:hypothetical protein n=1 Tax=Streptosporangium sp. NPDC001559 TaxID=3366187 RepID=UPI0036E06E9E